MILGYFLPDFFCLLWINTVILPLKCISEWDIMDSSGEKWGKCLSSCLIQHHMFIGEYSHNLDDKGRLAVPKKFRTDLAKGAVVTRGLDNCLFLFTKKEWTKLAEKLASLPFAQANTRAFARLMLAGAMDVDIDSQGRIILPEYLREFAGIGKEVVVAGLYSRLEIWDKEKWQSYKQKTEGESSQIAEHMGTLGV